MLSNTKFIMSNLFIGLLIIIVSGLPASIAGDSSLFNIWDSLSLMVVFGLSILLFCCVSNNINYNTLLFAEARSHFLIQTYIISGMLFTVLTNSIILYYTFSPLESGLDGLAWSMLGRSLAVAFITIFYALCFALSCYMLYKKNLIELDEKVISIHKSNNTLSIISILLFIMFFGYAIFLNAVQSGVPIKTIFMHNYQIMVALSMLILFFIVLGKNITTIISSFNNNNHEVYSLKSALDSVRLFMKTNVVFGALLMTVIFIYIGANFGDLMQKVLPLLSLLSFSMMFLLFMTLVSKVIELRLILNLLGLNYSIINIDKYFLIQYITPIYLVYWIIISTVFTLSFFM